MDEVKLIKGNNFIDDRGVLTFANDFDLTANGIRRFYNVDNHKAGFIRAWHGHLAETKYLFAEKGTVLVGVVPLNKYESQMKKFILSENKPEILIIPGGFFNGFKTLTDDAKLKVYSNRTLEESLNDDIRLDWNYWTNFWNDSYR